MTNSNKKTVLITGCSQGIGWAIASLFKLEGWEVCGIDCHQPSQTGLFEIFYKGDVSDNTTFKGFFVQFEKMGRSILHCLVNNAALQLCSSIEQTRPEDWDQVMAVNVKGPFLALQASLPYLKKAGGASVINMSSVHSIATSPGMAAYVSSKGGLSAFTRAAALELISDGIRVNAVAPGAIDTPMLRSGLNRRHLRNRGKSDRVEGLLDLLGKKHPAGRVGNGIDVAQAVLFLADPKKSSFVIGQTVTVDGGAIAHLSTE